MSAESIAAAAADAAASFKDGHIIGIDLKKTMPSGVKTKNTYAVGERIRTKAGVNKDVAWWGGWG